MLAGASTVFFAYIGFDSVASTAEEVLPKSVLIYLSGFEFDPKFKKAKKTFESCRFNLKIFRMYKMSFNLFVLNIVPWKVKIKELPKK